MASRPYRITVAAAYHLSLVAGIVLMPLALLARQIGLSLPLDRILRRLATAYEHATPDSR